MSDVVPYSAFLAQVGRHPPEIAIVLGSGMGPLVERVKVLASVSYGELPGFCLPTVHGHRGRLTLCRWQGRVVLLCEGRLHFYEGHPWERVTSLIRLTADLGVRIALFTNAAGGIHESLSPGSLMLIRDHLDLIEQFWWRKPSRPSPYSERLRSVARGLVPESLLEGIYAMCSGPMYETPAEVRAIRSWGADAVGMSTGREVEAAAAMGVECLALSCITNRAAGLSAGTLDHREVIEMAALAANRMADLLGGIVRES